MSNDHKQYDAGIENEEAFWYAVMSMGTQVREVGRELSTSVAVSFEEKDLTAMVEKLKNSVTVIKDLGKIFEPIKQGIMEVISAGDEFQNAFNNIKMKTQATDEEMKQFGDTLKSIYANNFGESMGDVSDALATVIQQMGSGWDTAQLQKMTEYALTMRDTFGTDIGESVQTAKDLMAELGISAEDAYGMLAQSAQGGTDSCGNVSTVMDDIINSKCTSLSSAMGGLGRTISTGFVLPISEQLIPKLSEMADRLKAAFQSPEMQESMARITDSLAGLGEGVVDFVSNQLPGLLDGLAWMMDHASGIAAAVVGIGTALTTIKIGKALAGLPELIGKTKDIAGVGKALSMAFGGPVTMVVAAIAAIGTALVTLYVTNEDFRNAVNNTFGAIRDTVVNVATAIATFFTETIPAAFQSVVEFFTVTLPAAFQPVVDFFTVTIPETFQGVVTFFQENWQNLLLLILNPFVGAFALLYDNCEGFRTKVNEIFDAIVGFFMGIPEKISNALAVLPELIGNIMLWLGELPGRLQQLLTDIISRVVTWAGELKIQAQTAAVNLVETFVAFVQALPQRVMGWLSNVVSTIVEFGVNVKASAVEAATGLVQAMVDKVQELPAKIKEIAGNIVEGLLNGVKEKIGSVTSFFGDLVEGVKEKFTGKKGFDTHSPSKWAHQVGTFVTEGLVNGLRDGTGRALEAAGRVADSVKASLDAMAPDMKLRNQSMTAEQGRFWDELVQITAQGASEMAEAENAAARQQESASKSIYDQAVKWIEEKKFYNQLSAADEIKAWELVAQKEGLLAEQRQQIDRNLYTARKALDDEQKRRDEEYQRNMESRIQALQSFAGLFDAVELKNDVTGDQLLTNLESQRDAFLQWQSDMNKLSSFGGMTDQLMAELQKMGPKSADEIHALADMTDQGLQKYIDVFTEKSKLVAQRVQQEFGKATLVAPAGQEDEDAQEESNETLIAAGAAVMDTVRQGIGANVVKITEITELIAKEFIAVIERFVPDFSQAGGHMVDGLWSGIQAGKSGLINNVITMLREAVAAARAELDMYGGDETQFSVYGASAQSFRAGISAQMADVSATIRMNNPAVSTVAEQNRSGSTGVNAGDVTVNQYYYGVKEQETSFRVKRETKRALRELGWT